MLLSSISLSRYFLRARRLAQMYYFCQILRHCERFFAKGVDRLYSLYCREEKFSETGSFRCQGFSGIGMVCEQKARGRGVIALRPLALLVNRRSGIKVEATTIDVEVTTVDVEATSVDVEATAIKAKAATITAITIAITIADDHECVSRTGAHQHCSYHRCYRKQQNDAPHTCNLLCLIWRPPLGRPYFERLSSRRRFWYG